MSITTMIETLSLLFVVCLGMQFITFTKGKDSALIICGNVF